MSKIDMSDRVGNLIFSGRKLVLRRHNLGDLPCICVYLLEKNIQQCGNMDRQSPRCCNNDNQKT